MDSSSFIGNKVAVEIDRPLGSLHPTYGYPYPVNYGFVSGTVRGDGEELDVYVLGPDEPLDQFDGDCIALIKRKNEADDKLIVVPVGTRLTEETIHRQVNFQEKFFKSEIVLLRLDL